MKKKLFPAILALVCAICCMLSFVACSGDDGAYKPTALEKAYRNYNKTENMTVTVTDSRTVKYGNDYSALVKVDYSHKAAYKICNHEFIAEYFSREYYYEITDEPNFIIYSRYETLEEREDGTRQVVYSNWGRYDRADLFDDVDLSFFGSQTGYEIHLLSNWVSNCILSHSLSDTGWRESENSDGVGVSLGDLLRPFTESADGYTADVYFCINNDGVYVPYACTVTVKLDAQDRFESVIADFGTNGKITAEYAYGATEVIIPEEVKNATA